MSAEESFVSSAERTQKSLPESRMSRRNSKTKEKNTAKKAPSKRKRRRAQDIIPYQSLNEIGICWLGDKRYSATLELSDIDYQMGSESQQQGILERYALLLNSLDPNENVQIMVTNRLLDKEKYASSIHIPTQGDDLDIYRSDYNDLMSERVMRGRNSRVTQKYFTLTIQAEDAEQARQILLRRTAELRSQFRSVGQCEARMLEGRERVRIMHSILRPNEPFLFDYTDLIGTKLSTKDIIAPWGFDFRDPTLVKLLNEQESVYRTLVLRDLPPYLGDRLIKELAEISGDVTVSLHIHAKDPADGMALVQRQIAGMQMQIINEQKKADKQGYSRDMIPHELVVSHQEATELRERLEQNNEKLFETSLIIGVGAQDIDQLNEYIERVQSVCRKNSVIFETLKYMQQQGITSVLPLGVNDVPIQRTLTTMGVAIIMPFTTREIMVENGMCYGINAVTSNLIIADRTSLMNGNAFTLGTSGSGKSQSGKWEIAATRMMRPDDDIIIIDPEKEYWSLCDAFHGERIEIHAASPQTLNALDIDLNASSEDGSPIEFKCQFVISLCDVLLGGKFGLDALQKSLLDRCAKRMYTDYVNTPEEQRVMPTLETLFEYLRRQDEPEANVLATSLEMYAKGSLAGFAKPTNVTLTNRLTVFDISRLDSDLMKTFGMLVVMDQIWQRVQRNREEGRWTWLYIDEFHLLFANDYAASYSQMLYKRARKWGLLPCGLTQNIAELLQSEKARLMLANSSTLTLLNQEADDADTLQELFGFSDEQRDRFTNVLPGCGLLRVGNATVAFDNRMPTNSELYKLFSTKFKED